MPKAAKHGGVVGNIWSSHRGRVEDASDKLEAMLALLDCAVGLGGCKAELAKSAHPLGFVGVLKAQAPIRLLICVILRYALSHLD
eukprot:2710027-Pleurochrysis_carterae.AAC.1